MLGDIGWGVLFVVILFTILAALAISDESDEVPTPILLEEDEDEIEQAEAKGEDGV